MKDNLVDESARLVIAYIGKPVGLKGQLKLHIQSDFVEQFKKGVVFSVNNRNITVENFDKERMLIKFLGYDTIDSAQTLSGGEINTTVEDSRKNCKLENDEFFWFDIISCNIIEENIVLGKVTDIERFTGQDYLNIETSSNLLEQNLPKSFLLPYIDRFIISVDIKNKIINVKNAKDILEAS